ncbi:accessory Sec system glycosyltransferase Asp1 [Lacticaseibacillus huelsenbergensis]|uniref:accessory Sec system glycosyltransferase Asp1 n=1 Tax=Lacticaseibacillus huelsenbergensis TaxID=3035291 RepID=UPI0024344D55|nr:accessory Sec system glycosyltransferase Asp1 [Lacticaseibacillus huelsenbergensis]WFB43030.1 accessory Sec system glycosyltransferase Asp1 [Lacticaseibacillus huelsenbergensis]
MNYFIGNDIFVMNSRTEFSQAQRVHLFKDMGLRAQYVTRNYNPLLAHNRLDLGLQAEDVLNMYDFFQGTVDVQRREQNLRLLSQIPLDEYHLIAHGPNETMINEAGREIAKIQVMPGTVGLVHSITYLDRFNNPAVRENFDWRGFKSSVDYFHPDGQLAVQKFLNLAGKTVLEVTHMNIEGNVQPTMWKLLDYKGRNFRFNLEDQLFLFFLNELTAAHPHSLLISDRRDLDYVVASVQQAGSKWAYLHDVPLRRSGKRADWLPAYQPLLEEHRADFDGLIVATVAEQKDLRARLPDLPVIVAPDTYVPRGLKPINEAKRDPHLILFVGRLSPEKRPDQAIRVLAKVHETLPDAKLEFRGYAIDQDYLEKLKDLAKKEGVREQVAFADYVTGDQLASVYEKGSVILQTSRNEGFGMNLLEAMSYGVPIVAYDTPYGASALVADGVNGYLAKNGAITDMAAKVTKILSDRKLWEQMHTAALEKRGDFSQANAETAWQKAMKDIRETVGSDRSASLTSKALGGN